MWHKILVHCNFDNIIEQKSQIYLPNNNDNDLSLRDLMKNPKSKEISNKQLSVNKQTNTEKDSHTQRYPKQE